MQKNNNLSTSSQVTRGIWWALLASIMWGVSGTVLQVISQGENIPAGWYLSVRTLGAGVILIIISAFMYGKKIFAVFESWRMVGWLVAYALLGLLANLLTFYMSIQTGNASSSTILQYLSPLFIVLGAIVIKHEKPNMAELVSFVVALVGVFLAITHGDIHQLAIPMVSVIWGVLSGVTAAFYIVLPKPITKYYSPMIVLGWAFLIASLVLNIFNPFWVNVPEVSTRLVWSMSTVIVVGTILPFLCILHSLKFAPSASVSIVDAAQPVVTFVLSLLFLGMKFNWVEFGGVILVIIAIYILQRFSE
ncbi:DMT family transporter [Lentilactobacillus senioris]|uniref:DMT family transporter n=1 Tax=Lentilactobacillus senioris TaxID=931534 RepID=UPI00228311A0|nr:DMT family transporter [Lentilactobacillus senioris]MCY9806221.1 DMT family transporter [Lentilactobacillus senioris]